MQAACGNTAVHFYGVEVRRQSPLPLLQRPQRDTLRDASKGVAGGCLSGLAGERNTFLVCVDQQRSHERRGRWQRRAHELGRQRRHEPSGRRHEPGGRRHEPSGRRHEPSRRRHEPSGRRHEPSRRRHEPSRSSDDGRLLRTRGWVLRHKALVHHDDGGLVQRCLHRRRLRERGLAMSEWLLSSQSVSVLRCPHGVSPRKGRGRVHGRSGECQLQRRHLDVPGRHRERGGLPVRAFRRRCNGGRGRRSSNDVSVASQCSSAARPEPAHARHRYT